MEITLILRYYATREVREGSIEDDPKIFPAKPLNQGSGHG